MATAISEGARSTGNVEVELNYHIEPEELGDFDAVIVGTPTHHKDMSLGIKKLLAEALKKGISLKGKVGATFGSYGWSGEAPKLVLDILQNKFEMKITEPPLLSKYAPDQNLLNACRNLGKRIAESLIHTT